MCLYNYDHAVQFGRFIIIFVNTKHFIHKNLKKLFILANIMQLKKQFKHKHFSSIQPVHYVEICLEYLLAFSLPYLEDKFK